MTQVVTCPSDPFDMQLRKQPRAISVFFIAFANTTAVFANASHGVTEFANTRWKGLPASALDPHVQRSCTDPTESHNHL